MKLSVMLNYSGDVMAAADEVVQLENAGLDCVWVAEAYSFDAISMMGYLAGRSNRLEIGSAIVNIYSVIQSGGGSPYVTSWSDKSSSGAALANGTSSSSITYSASAINGHPAIVTTGSAVLSNSTTYGPQSTVFVVAKMTGAAKQRILSGLNNNWLLGWWWGYENQAYFNGWLYQPSLPATTNPIVYSATTGNGQATFWRNGTQIASSSGGFASPAGLQVGGGYFGNTEYSAANIGEVIIYNRILTVSERQSVESYLAGKWGVASGG